MPQIVRSVPPIESMLLRKSVGALAARRPRCFHCRRTPLVGEHVHVYETGAGECLVCELCRPLRQETPARSEVVRSVEHDRAVRRRQPRAA
jgi:hypothetical protein